MTGYLHITPNWKTTGISTDFLAMIVDIDMYVELHGGKTTYPEDCGNGRWCFKAKFQHDTGPVEIGFFVEDGDGFFANASGGGATYRIDPMDLFKSLEPIGQVFGPKTRN